jgi:hypothetical protein
MAKIDQRLYDHSNPDEYEDFVRPADADGESPAEVSIQKTTIHVKWIETVLNGEEFLDQNAMS